MPSMNLASFITHLAGFHARLLTYEHESLERAARLVRREARDEIGHYQAAASPFGPWQELADRTKDERVRQGFSENDPGLRTGGMRDSIGYDVGHKEAVVGSDDQKLEFFELGTVKQPPRAVLGMAAVHKGHEVAELLGEGVVRALVGGGVHRGRLEF